MAHHGRLKSGRRLFANPEVMPSAKSQDDQNRRNAAIKAEQEYFKEPPRDEILFKATLVVPGKQMNLPQLNNPSCFDHIRKPYRVWISQEKPNVLHIHSRTMQDLKRGFKAINWTIHDMRLAQHSVSSLFFVQPPLYGGTDCLVIVDLDTRPKALSQDRLTQLVAVQGPSSSMSSGIMEQIGRNFIVSMNTLRSLKKTLQMRVDFGHVIIRRRKKIQGNTMTYPEFSDMATRYGKRGGADFESKIEGSGLISDTISHLLKPATEFFNSHQKVTFNDRIVIKVQRNILEADVNWMETGPATLTNACLKTPDQYPPLRWTIMAPDRDYDWCFRVDAAHTGQPLPTQMSNLISSVKLTAKEYQHSEIKFLDKSVNIRIVDPASWADQIDEIQLRSSVAIPFRDTPYVIEITRTRVWKDIKTQSDSQSWYGMGFIGVHWAAELNSHNANYTKKDWGINQKDVWLGSSTSEEGQFNEFLCHVLECLSALEGVR